ncbi:MAG TPA: M64 family metallopeptidase, partial [Gaiellaceae bacterium]|nr:M64 family metallopeptidase [Gaiellaceae bacterium]
PQPGGGCPNVPGDPAVGLGDARCSGNQQHSKYMAVYLAPLGVSGQNVQTLAISNTFTYGGIGGTQATTSGGSPQGPLISMHELGHSLGQLSDEYPYSARDVPGSPHPNTEPGSFHHTRLTHDEMVSGQLKWWRWLCEESLSGGIITTRDSTCGPPHESGLTRGSNVWRPSEHSMMRWLGFYFDQIGREHMTYRITGRRNANAMALDHTPLGEVGPEDVVWVETGHPRYHELEVSWTVNGVPVAGAEGSRNLDLGGLGAAAGDVVQVTVKDPTDFVRDPAFKDGPRLTQTRQWTVGAPLPAAPVEVAFTISSPTDRPLAGDEVAYVETTHPTDRVLDVTWRLAIEGKPFSEQVLPNPQNSRNLDLGALGLPAGTYVLSATVTDPAAPGGASETRTWTVDNVTPSAPAELSEPLVRLSSLAETTHNVYFDEFTMGLEPTDDQPGFVVGEFRLNGDGWFNYFGFPEEPFGTPFTFSHSGKNVKALTYGNLGTGGLSKATFEQAYPDFEPGYGTHTVEHRAIDAVGNIGEADEFRATVLPGSSPECTETLSGKHRALVVSTGVTCLDEATVSGGVTVLPGASLVVSGGLVRDGITASGAGQVQLFGVEVRGDTRVEGTTGGVTIAGAKLKGRLSLVGNAGGEFDVALVGSLVKGLLECSGNTPGVGDYGVPNTIEGLATADCEGL